MGEQLGGLTWNDALCRVGASGGSVYVTIRKLASGSF